jgi:hypothetical protein
VTLANTTRQPLLGPWIRGQLVLHHVSPHDPRITLDDWIAAVHASVATAPADVLKKLNEQLVVAEVQVDPARARATWGLLPEHQVTTPAEQRFTETERR